MHPSSYWPARKPAAGGTRFKAVLRWALFLPVWILSMQDAHAQQDLQAFNQRVIQLYQAGNKSEAISLAEKTVEMARSKLGPEHKTTGILLSQLGNLYRDAGRFAEAETALKQVIPIFERASGPNFELAQALNNLGGVYLNQEMFSDAEKLFKRSLAVYEKLPAGK